MTPRKLPKYEVLSFSSFFLLGWQGQGLSRWASASDSNFPKKHPVQLLKDKDKLSK